MSQLSLGFQALYMCSRSVNGCRLKDGHAHCTGKRQANQVQYMEPQEDHFSLAFISITIQLRI